jgi:hypothetical protein
LIESPSAGATRVGARPGSPSWAGWWLAGLVGAGLALALRAWGQLGDTGDSICLLRQVAHLDCPTCGLTRSLVSLARGDWVASLGYHPLGVLLAIQLVAGWVLWGAGLARGRRALPEGWTLRLVVANGGALLALWLVRLITGALPA